MKYQNITQFVSTSITLIFFMFVCLSYEQNPNIENYLVENSFMNDSDKSPEALKTAITNFQKTNDLQITGSMTEESRKEMSRPRCGKPPDVNKVSCGNKWTKSHLTYKIKTWPPPFTEGEMRDLVENYITLWTDKINLTITESTLENADIEIFSEKIDGNEWKLAYAYFPEDGGDIYIDADENWTLLDCNEYPKIFIGWTVGHEMGHALGLCHSENENSIMVPVYSEYQNTLKPSETDLNQILSLYGETGLNNTMLCNKTPVNALLKTENFIVIKGKKYWTISNNILAAGPFSLELKFPGLPDEIDAAFSIKNSSYFFKNKIMYKFTQGKKDFVQKLISVAFEQVPNNINAAFFNPRNKYLYFFKESMYYVYDTRQPIGKRLVAERSLRDWNIPDNIEAATLLDEDKILFIKNFVCYTVNLATKKLMEEKSCDNFYNC